MATIDDLPDAVWRDIVDFLRNPFDFRSLEKTCHRFHSFFEEDEAWEYCCKESLRHRPPEGVIMPEPRSPCNSFRDEAFRPYAVAQIRKWQRSTESILYPAFTRPDGFGLNAFGEILSAEDGLHLRYEGNHAFSLRGDASSVLMEILEASMIQQLKSAMRLAIHGTGPDDFPSVCAEDFKLQDEIRQEVTGILEKFTPLEVYPYEDESPEKQKGITTIVRRLAYRAGIAKMENCLYGCVWGTLKNMISLMVRPGCIELANRDIWIMPSKDNLAADEKRLVATMVEDAGFTWRNGIMHLQVPLEQRQSMRDYAPHPEYIPPTNSASETSKHILVPRHIVDAAKNLGIPYTVYRFGGWHNPTGDETLTREYARSMYYGPGADINDELSEVDSEAYEYEEDESEDMECDEWDI